MSKHRRRFPGSKIKHPNREFKSKNWSILIDDKRLPLVYPERPFSKIPPLTDTQRFDIPLTTLPDMTNIIFDFSSKKRSKRKRAYQYYMRVDEGYRLTSRQLHRLNQEGVLPISGVYQVYLRRLNLFSWLLARFDRVRSISSSVRQRIEINRRYYQEERDDWINFYKTYDKTDWITRLLRVLGSSAIIGGATLMTAREQLIKLLDDLSQGYGALSYVMLMGVAGGLLLGLGNLAIRFWVWSRITWVKHKHHMKIVLTDIFEKYFRDYLANQTIHDGVIEYARAGYWEEVREYLLGYGNLTYKEKIQVDRLIDEKDLVGLKEYVERSRKRSWPFTKRFVFKLLEYIS